MKRRTGAMGWRRFRVLGIGCLSLFGLLTGAARADEAALVRVGESWRYWRGSNAPSAMPGAWRSVGFDDSAWPSGPSGFGAYGAATVLSDFGWAGYVSVYLRREFSVEDLESVRWLVLRADYQDGFVAYLNGVEIARRGMAGAGEPSASELATASHPDGTAEELDLTRYRALLRPGRNVLAAQAHTASASYGSFSLNLELLANLTRGPFLQDATPRGLKIVWHTPVPADSRVEYSVDEGPTQTWYDPTPTNIHVATLTGLTPDTSYRYRVVSADSTGPARSPWYRFRTLREQGDATFLMVGDTGLGGEAQYRIGRVMAQAEADLVVHLGDVVYPRFTAGRADLKCFSVYQPQMAERPWFFLYGNHDRYDNPVDFAAAFYSPTNPVTGGGQFYSFEHGDAHFAALDTDLGVGVDWSEGSPQYRWLEADLAGCAKPWKFICLHNAFRGSGPHRWDDYNSNRIYDRLEFQNTIGRLAERYGVQAIFAAHDHLYERVNPMGGAHMIVSGGGGGVLYGFGGEWEAGSCQFRPQYHCVRVRVQGDRLELAALDAEGRAFDTLHLGRAAPARRLFEAAWHTPTLAFQGENDGDGNRLGQEFDFVGSPIPSVAGAFSNLGDLYVNHDANTLFLGVDQAMLYPSNNLFLFVEAPGLPGVSTLAGLGNGAVDPEGEGADGLDFLENLSFTRFTPGVGCVLGDEYGDGQDRAFARVGLPIAVGQGAFYLDKSLTSVPGVRLEQFNRSPQLEAAPHEQDANFIALAMPLEALGSPRPGDILRVGAVVGGGMVDTRASVQARQLDRGFVGYGLDGAGLGPARLEGIEVRLAAPPAPPVDSDGDGLSDAEELLAGTDPRDARSNLRVGVDRQSADSVRLWWSAVPGKAYFVERAVRAAGPYLPPPALQQPWVATGSLEGLVISGWATNIGAWFYRVRVAR